MAASFFFYDLETSGFDPRQARIMQFAGQRTDMDLNPVGEPVNTLIRLTPDVLPDPDAVLITGITPQATIQDGITEAEFLKFFNETLCVPDTIFAGYNSVRFDDEFMRFLLYRNFCDPYRWHWCDGCSRWDLLDVVRITRALRPGGIEWPFGTDGRASNRLELLTGVNKLEHSHAHDALSDVYATIAVARLIKAKQPKLFGYLLEMRDKKKVAALVESGKPFVYTSGAYAGEHEKTTVAVKVADAPNNQGVLVYDLRYDPDDLAKLSAQELADRWRWRKDRRDDEPRVPVKALRYNRCPAVAPLSVLDEASRTRLHIDMTVIEVNARKLAALGDLPGRLVATQEQLHAERPQASLLGNEHAADGQLYDNLLDNRDQAAMRDVCEASADGLRTLDPHFHDTRLQALFPLYKARNVPSALTDEERATWEQFCAHRLLDGGPKSRVAKYFERLQTLAATPGMTQAKQYLLEELRLYGESIVPAEG